MAKLFFKNLLTLFFVTTIIFGCSIHKNVQTNSILLSDKELQIIAQNHLTNLTKLNSWKFKARVQVKTKDDYAKFSVAWQQKNNAYNCNVTGPLAVSIAKISGKENHISLAFSDKNIVGTNPNKLIKELTGFYVPIEAIPTWIKGTASVNYPAEKTLNCSGQISQLKQQGYQIQYSNYKQYKNYMLPSKINITNADVSIAIIISKWKI